MASEDLTRIVEALPQIEGLPAEFARHRNTKAALWGVSQYLLNRRGPGEIAGDVRLLVESVEGLRKPLLNEYSEIARQHRYRVYGEAALFGSCAIGAYVWSQAADHILVGNAVFWTSVAFGVGIYRSELKRAARQLKQSIVTLDDLIADIGRSSGADRQDWVIAVGSSFSPLSSLCELARADDAEDLKFNYATGGFADQ